MSLADLPLEQLITVVFEVAEPRRRVVVAIEDAPDGTAAEMTADWANKAFTLDDLLGSIVPHAKVVVTENDGNPEHYTGETFDAGSVLRELDGVEPTSVTFADLPLPRPVGASPYGARPAGLQPGLPEPTVRQ